MDRGGELERATNQSWRSNLALKARESYLVVEDRRAPGVNTVNSPKRSLLTDPWSCVVRSIIHSSGIISPTSFPPQNKRTTELSETTIPMALVTALILA